jgi:chromosome segregation ATPase
LYDLNAVIKDHLAIIDSGMEGQSIVECFFEESTNIQVTAHFSAMMLQLKRTGEKVAAQQMITVKELAELNTWIAGIVEELQSVWYQVDISSAEAQASVKVMDEQLVGSDQALQETRIVNEGLKEWLSCSQKDEEDLRAWVTSLQSSVWLLTKELENSMATTKQLQVEQAGIASELQEKETAIANLTESKMQSMSKISTLLTQLQDAKKSIMNLERERDMSCVMLTRIKSECNHIWLDLMAIWEERQQLTEKLSITEVMQDHLSTKVHNKQRDIQDLEATLESLEVKAKNLTSTLEVSEAEMKVTAMDYDSKLSALKNNMASMQNEVNCLQSEVLYASAETRKTKSQLDESRAECARIQEILEAKRLHAIELDKDHEDALGRVWDAEEDI